MFTTKAGTILPEQLGEDGSHYSFRREQKKKELIREWKVRYLRGRGVKKSFLSW